MFYRLRARGATASRTDGIQSDRITNFRDALIEYIKSRKEIAAPFSILALSFVMLNVFVANFMLINFT